MVVELCYSETLDVVNNPRAKAYIKQTLDVLNFLVENNLSNVNDFDRHYIAFAFNEHIFHSELYGGNNHCRGVYACLGRLPSNGDTFCYFSKYFYNIEITIIDKRNDVYFTLDLYTTCTNAIRCGVMFDTEKFE